MAGKIPFKPARANAAKPKAPAKPKATAAPKAGATAAPRSTGWRERQAAAQAETEQATAARQQELTSVLSTAPGSEAETPEKRELRERMIPVASEYEKDARESLASGGTPISDNVNHSDYLKSMARELSLRINNAKNTKKVDVESNLKNGVEPVSQAQSARLAEASWHLDKFQTAIDRHQRHHLKGNVADALRYMTQAADHLHDAVSSTIGARPEDKLLKTGVAPQGDHKDILKDSYGEKGDTWGVSLENAHNNIQTTLDSYRNHVNDSVGIPSSVQRDSPTALAPRQYKPEERSPSAPVPQINEEGKLTRRQPWETKRRLPASVRLDATRSNGQTYALPLSHPIAQKHAGSTPVSWDRENTNLLKLFPNPIPEEYQGIGRAQHAANMDAVMNHHRRNFPKEDFLSSRANQDPYGYMKEHKIQGYVDWDKKLIGAGLPTIKSATMSAMAAAKKSGEFYEKDENGEVIQEPVIKNGSPVIKADGTPRVRPKVNQSAWKKEFGSVKDIPSGPDEDEIERSGEVSSMEHHEHLEDMGETAPSTAKINASHVENSLGYGQEEHEDADDEWEKSREENNKPLNEDAPAIPSARKLEFNTGQVK